MTLEVSLAVTPVQVVMAAGPTVTVAEQALTLDLSTPGFEQVIQLSQPTITVTAAAVSLALAASTILLDFSGVGPQGSPGSAQPQIYDQATAPTPIAGFTLLWFQSGVSADPNDREMNLVEFP